MTALPRLDDVQTIEFGAAGNSGRFVRSGWGVAEAGFRWMTGQESVIRLPLPDPGSDHMLLLDVAPFVAAGAPPAQRLTVLANGYELADHALSGRRVLPVYLPAEVLAGSSGVELVLRHPDARRISDVLPVADRREVAVSMRRLRVMRMADGDPPPVPADVAPPEDRDLMLLFESLGETDAFARVQRAFGADPFGLLRHANLPMQAAINLLADDFAGIDREAARLMIGAGKLRRVLAGGEKLCVFTSAAPLADEAIIPLLVALRDRGPNTLLWVVDAADGVAPGTVEPLMEGALRGHVRQVHPAPDAQPDDLADWLAVCRGAWALWERREAAQAALAA